MGRLLFLVHHCGQQKVGAVRASFRRKKDLVCKDTQMRRGLARWARSGFRGGHPLGMGWPSHGPPLEAQMLPTGDALTQPWRNWGAFPKGGVGASAPLDTGLTPSTRHHRVPLCRGCHDFL